ncbi:PREDICTED: transcription factor bHLH36-like [Nelumbo nucifera]|uniref:Transcription factor bHLH36-like n=2 Tax=Nelumbo nucifera TaxID=4432 RepID=A0A1U8B821_NELNU|nr:PREDICTED: transcription factor bHLH36-like [Nelumbo nucifera]DAD20967.1 TPA_asm: hypothetical protein HUJ06_022430 [Nelumbo nucifera]
MEDYDHSSSKVDRRTVEKIRRNHMKNLYAELNSLIPSHGTKETMALPDQIEEATNYIKMLQQKLERMKEKKASIMGLEGITSGMMVRAKSPHIEIHDMGSALQAVLVSGLDHHQLLFYEIIRLLHDEGAEIVSASFSVVDNSVFHTIHAEVGESTQGFEGTKISRRLQNFVHQFVEAS